MNMIVNVGKEIIVQCTNLIKIASSNSLTDHVIGESMRSQNRCESNCKVYNVILLITITIMYSGRGRRFQRV